MPFSSEQHASQPDDFAESRAWHARALDMLDKPCITSDPMPSELIAAMALVKRASGRQPASAAPAAQSFTTALHVAASVGVAHNLLPALANLRAELSAKAELYRQTDQVSAAQDAEEHLNQLTQACDAIERALPAVYRLNMGEGLSATLGEQAVQRLADTLDLPFVHSAKKLTAQASLDTLISLHGTLRTTALALMQISNGLGHPPSHSPSFATQCDALSMVCCQVVGNDVSLSIGASAGQHEGRSFNPLLAHMLLQSIRLLTDGTTLFTEFFVRGIAVNRERISNGLASSLILVTSRLHPG